MKKKMVCVLGMHRSGTSLISNILQHLGVFWGKKEELLSGNESNRDGYFELCQILNTNNHLLYISHTAWNSCQWIDDSIYTEEKFQPYIDYLVEYLSGIYLNNNINIFGFKEPRTSILLSLWKQVFSKLDIEPLYVWVFRNPEEVSQSLEQRDMYKKEYSYCLWNYYNLKILKNLQGETCHFLNYNELLKFPEKTCKDLFDFIYEQQGIFQPKKIEGIIKQSYRHSTENENSYIHNTLTSDIISIIKKLSNISKIRVKIPSLPQLPELKERYIQESTYFDRDSYQAFLFLEQTHITERYQKYYNLLLTWLSLPNTTAYIKKYICEHGYTNVILYGIGYLGKLTLNILLKEHITVDYIIDAQQAENQSHYLNIPIQKKLLTHNAYNSVLIVTPITDFVSIKYFIQKENTEIDVISLDSIIC